MLKVGKTPLIKKRILGLDVLIKDESKNPFGTYKDRRSKEIIKEAKRKRANKLVVISSGNSCYSLSRFAKDSGLKTVCIVDVKLRSSIKKILRKYAHRVIETNLTKKKLSSKEILEFVNAKQKEKLFEVSNGFHKAYFEIIMEIKKIKPNYVIVPIGSGEAFVGLYDGIRKYKLKSKLIGVGVKNKTKSFDLTYKYCDKHPEFPIWQPTAFRSDPCYTEAILELFRETGSEPENRSEDN